MAMQSRSATRGAAGQGGSAASADPAVRCRGNFVEARDGTHLFVRD